MKVSFKQLLNPMHETILVNGEPFLLEKKYDNVVREDDNIILTFMPSGIVHLELKECIGQDPRVAYVKCNDFMNTFFPKALKVSKDTYPDREVFFGFIECECMLLRDGQKFKRTINIDNAYSLYKDGHGEHDGINFYITEEPVNEGGKKQKKGKKKK